MSWSESESESERAPLPAAPHARSSREYPGTVTQRVVCPLRTAQAEAAAQAAAAAEGEEATKVEAMSLYSLAKHGGSPASLGALRGGCGLT
eukprot:2801693-Rhodomonas_salina.1